MILTAHDTQRLRAACPDLDSWPEKWQFGPEDLPIGEQVVGLFIPFILHMLDKGLAKATVRRHRDNLWLLGGELIKRRYDDKRAARLDVSQFLLQLIDEDGGPFVGPSISESEQDSLDATCRKLHRFRHTDAAPRTGVRPSLHPGGLR